MSRFECAIGELADTLDIMPADALDAVIASGVRTYWHEGHRYRSGDELQEFLSEYQLFNLIREVEVELDDRQIEWFAQHWDIDLLTADIQSAKPLRKFVASEAKLPGVASQFRLQG